MTSKGYVYAISNERGAVKIGWSNNPSRRLAELNTHDAETCVLLGATEGTPDDEREAHKLLAKHRIRGEWFDRSASAVSFFVSQLGKPEGIGRVRFARTVRSVLPRRAPKCRLEEFRRKEGMTLVDLAEKLGTTHASLSRIENGRQTPSLSMIQRIVEATDGFVLASDFLPTASSSNGEKFGKFLRKNRITSAQFAKSIGVSVKAVTKWRSGERFPRPENVRSIEKATDGLVSFADFLPEDQGRTSHIHPAG